MTPPLPGPDAGLNAAVAAELRAEMGRKKISARDLAQLSEIPYGTLRRYLAAERHIDVAVLDQVTGALGVTPVDIVVAAQTRTGVKPRESALDRYMQEQQLDAVADAEDAEDEDSAGSSASA